MNLRNNFDIPGFRRRPLIPFGRLNGEVALIATAIWTALTTTGFGITVAGVTVGITWGGAIVVAAVIGLEIWSLTSQGGGSGRAGPGLAGGSSIDQNGQLVNTRQATKILPILYGIVRVGGNWIFSRPSSLDSGIFNEVITWGEGDIEGLATAIDFTPLYSGVALNDIHTGGTFVPGSCACNGPCYLHTACSCDMACDNTYA